MFRIRLPITMSAPCLELAQEARDLIEVVGQVGVGHHDVAAASRREARQIGAPVAALRLEHDVCAGGSRQSRRCRRRSRCRDDDLAVDVRCASSA